MSDIGVAGDGEPGGGRVKSFKLEWDREYGPSKRSGWSVCIDGSYVVELERSLLVALLKWWRRECQS